MPDARATGPTQAKSRASSSDRGPALTSRSRNESVRSSTASTRRHSRSHSAIVDADQVERGRVEVDARAARDDRSAQVAVADDGPGQPVQALLERGELGLADRQRRVLALADGDLEMVVEALELGQDPPDRLGPRRHLGLGQRLHRVRERERVGDARGARHALGDEHGQFERNLADPPFGAAALEEQALSAVGDVLAAGLDQELGGLEHTRADGPVRDHEHAGTGESLRAAMGQAHVLFLGHSHLASLGGVTDERLEARMALGDDPVQIVDLPFEPVRGRNHGRDGRIRAPVHRRAHPITASPRAPARTALPRSRRDPVANSIISRPPSCPSSAASAPGSTARSSNAITAVLRSPSPRRAADGSGDSGSTAEYQHHDQAHHHRDRHQRLLGTADASPIAGVASPGDSTIRWNTW